MSKNQTPPQSPQPITQSSFVRNHSFLQPSPDEDQPVSQEILASPEASQILFSSQKSDASSRPITPNQDWHARNVAEMEAAEKEAKEKLVTFVENTPPSRQGPPSQELLPSPQFRASQQVPSSLQVPKSNSQNK